MAIITDQRFYITQDDVYGKGGLSIDLLKAYGQAFHVTVFARVFPAGGEAHVGDKFPLCSNVCLVAIPRWDTMQIIAKAIAVSRFFRMNLQGFDVAVLRVGGISPLLAFCACLRNGIPYIVHRIGEPGNRYELDTKTRGSIQAKLGVGLALPIARWLTSHMEANASYRTAVSKTLAKELYGANLAVADTRLTGVDTKAVRNKHNDPFTILFVGRLVDIKNPQAVLYAASMLKSKLRRVKVVFVGEGPLEEVLRTESKRLGLESEVEFKGYIGDSNELWKQYETADVFVLPSYSEGLPLVIIEAMSTGLPVIATAVGGVPELVVNYESGLLLDRSDPCQIADAVLQIASSSELYGKLSCGAVHMARSYTVFEQVQVMRTIVERVLYETRM